MRKVFLLGAGAIVLVGAGMIALIWAVSEPAASRFDPLAPAPSGERPAVPAPGVPSAGGAAPQPQAPGAPQAERPGRPVVAARPEVGRAASTTPKALFAAVRPYADQAERCAAGGRRGPPGRAGSATVNLEMETLEGRVRVVGASVPGGQPADEPLLRCVRAQLVGREFEVAGSKPGRTYTMPYPFQR